MAKDSLAELARLASPSTTMRDSEVVEDEKVSRTERHLRLRRLDMQAVLVEEPKLGLEARELHAAEEVGIDLDARQHGRSAGRRLDDASEAPLDIAVGVRPGAVRRAVAGEPFYQFLCAGPRSLGQETGQ